jgi:hypothetical protein
MDHTANLEQPKYSKDTPNQHPLDNQSKTHDKKGKGKTKNDNEKWCDFHKIPRHNTNECRSKQSLVAEVKYMEPNSDLESDQENIENR